jgi:alpha-tubulin suppressor-like RCC1 family protein
MRFTHPAARSLYRILGAMLTTCAILISHSACAQYRLFGWGGNVNNQLGAFPQTFTLGNATHYGRAEPGLIRAFSGVTKIAVGIGHVLALKGDGTIWAWGYNNYGQLGDGRFSPSVDWPVQVAGLTNVISIAAGDSNSLALKSDGTVWTWGVNKTGELGNGTNDANVHSVPMQVTGLPVPVTAIASEGEFDMALASDGSVWMWGNNSYGQLGDGTTTERDAPIKVPGIANVTGISARGIASTGSSMAQTQDGSIWIWPAEQTKMPTQVPGLTGVTGMFQGYYVIKNDGTLWQINYPSNNVQIQGISNVSSVDDNEGSLTVTRTDGTVWTGSSGSFTQVSGINNAVQVQLGDKGSATFTIVLGSDGRLWSWGDNLFGQLAIPGMIDETRPVRSRFTLGSIKSLAVGVELGSSHFLAVRSDGSVVGWGENGSGQLGDGSNVSHYTPTPIANLSGMVQVAAGQYGSSYAVKKDGTVWDCGYNQDGQLGDGNTTNQYTPAQVPGITGVTAVAAGWTMAIALKNDGTVWSWGSNSYGELGSGAFTTVRPSAGQVINLNHVIAIAAYNQFSLALKSDGTVWGWGRNDYGQLGIGNTTSQNTPIQIPGLTHIVAIAAGYTHALALKNDGTVWAWGANKEGELGNGTTTASNTPQQVSGLTGVVQIAAGGSLTAAIPNPVGQSFAIKKDGSVWAWGYDLVGLLGDGIPTQGGFQLTPSQVDLPGVAQIVTSYSATLALVKDVDPDLNGDGNSDLLWQNSRSGQQLVWYMDGPDRLGAPALLGPPISTAWNLVGTADLNGDGHPDLLWQNLATGQVNDWLMNGATPVSYAHIYPRSPTEWHVVGTADINNDGSPDLIWQNTRTQAVKVAYLNNGVWTGQWDLLLTLPAGWRVTGTADMNGDSYPDIIAQNGATGDVMVWYIKATSGRATTIFWLQAAATGNWSRSRIWMATTSRT